MCDNGTELTSTAMVFWSARSGTMLHFIQPGKPTQNAFVESFNARFRDNWLNQHWFQDLHEAKQLIENWRRQYNQEPTHSSLGYATPAKYATRAASYDVFPSAQVDRFQGKDQTLQSGDGGEVLDDAYFTRKLPESSAASYRTFHGKVITPELRGSFSKRIDLYTQFPSTCVTSRFTLSFLVRPVAP